MASVCGLPEPGHPVVERQAQAVPLHVALHDARHLPVERRQDLVEHLDEGDVEAAMDEVLRRLEADEPAPDDDRPRLGPHRLEARVFVHPGKEQRPSLDPLADRPRVGHGPDLEDPRQVDAGQWRTDGNGPGRQHQLVVGLGGHVAGCDIAQLDGLLVRRDLDGLAARAHIDCEHRAKHRFAGHQEARLLFNHAADVVGQPAVRVRDIGAPLHHEDFRLFIQPAQARRTRRPSCHSANDDDFHDLFSLFNIAWSTEPNESVSPASRR